MIFGLKAGVNVIRIVARRNDNFNNILKKDTDFFNLPYIIITTINSPKNFIEFNLIYNLSNSIRKLVFS